MMHCFFANKRRHTRFDCDWSSDVCSSDLHACTEREALERLVSEAELGHDRLSRVRIDFDSSIHRRITLWVPDVVGQSQPPGSAVGLDEGLARLLVNVTTATTATVDPRRAAAPSDERLFITSRVSADAIVATLRRLE